MCGKILRYFSNNHPYPALSLSFGTLPAGVCLAEVPSTPRFPQCIGMSASAPALVAPWNAAEAAALGLYADCRNLGTHPPIPLWVVALALG